MPEPASVIICEPRPGCADENINRWYCHRDRSGICPIARCNPAEHEIRSQDHE